MKRGAGVQSGLSPTLWSHPCQQLCVGQSQAPGRGAPLPLLAGTPRPGGPEQEGRHRGGAECRVGAGQGAAAWWGLLVYSPQRQICSRAGWGQGPLGPSGSVLALAWCGTRAAPSSAGQGQARQRLGAGGCRAGEGAASGSGLSTELRSPRPGPGPLLGWSPVPVRLHPRARTCRRGGRRRDPRTAPAPPYPRRGRPPWSSRPPRPPPAWSSRRRPPPPPCKTWQANLRLVTKFSTVEDFWALYSHIQLASKLTSGCDYSLFKDGIEPMWEDNRNKCGGRWLITLAKQQRHTELDHFWLETLLCLIGESFGEYSAEVCGAVINIRAKGDKIAVWTCEAEDREGVTHIGRVYKERLGLSSKVVIGYQAHADTATKSGSLTKNKFVV
uniref:Eukaryotic translation initiation factor 4E family member 1B n=1 Tax=Crocodylus porosus TaxID=8502 RepID=A0A7M4F4D8_CROPO